MVFIWLGEKNSLKYLLIGGRTFVPISRRCRHRLCPDWLIPQKSLSALYLNFSRKLLISVFKMNYKTWKEQEMEDLRDEICGLKRSIRRRDDSKRSKSKRGNLYWLNMVVRKFKIWTFLLYMKNFNLNIQIMNIFVRKRSCLMCQFILTKCLEPFDINKKLFSLSFLINVIVFPKFEKLSLKSCIVNKKGEKTVKIRV